MTTYLGDSLASSLGPNYSIERELEGGGMSRLFLATDLALKRRVVVKVLASELVTPESTARFQHEIEWTIRLQHPNILPIFTSGSFGDCLYYVTPYIAGESLRARLKRDRQLSLDDTLKILRDVSDALTFAHAEGIVHRDVKPGNILLAGGHAILADFGIARAVETPSSALTASGLVPGTPAYMSPELPADASADVFALAIVAYEMLCGSLPVGEITVGGILASRRAMHDTPRGALLALADLVARAVSNARTPRVTDASVFLARIENARSRRQPDRRLVLIAAGVIGMALFAGGWAYMNGSWRTNLDPNAYMIAVADSDAASAALVEDVQSCLAEWRGVVSVAAPHGGSMRLTALEPVIRDAAGNHARNLIVLGRRPLGDSVEVLARLIDIASKQPIRDVKTRLSVSARDSNATMAMRRFVNAIVRDEDGDELPWRSATNRARADLGAWRAYDRGRAALRAWNLDAAADAFRDATNTDSSAALAQLWLAQTLQWLGPERRDDARAAAMRAATARALSRRDSIHDVGLSALLDRRHVDAQRAFHALLDSDSSYFPAWVDLGESLAGDSVVVPAPTSPTGWAFRSSYEEAARAYLRAGMVADRATAPNVRGWILGRLARVLYTAPNSVRVGFHVNRDSVGMGSFPYFDADTEAFAPHSMDDFASRKGDPSFDRVRRSVTRARAILRGVAEEWVQAAPNDAAAYDSLAILSELSDGKAYVAGKQLSTLELIRTARTLSRDTASGLPLAIAEVRALLKESRFDETRRLADSLLRHGARQHYRDVQGVVGLSALLGHVRETAMELPLADVAHAIRMPGFGAWIPPRQVEAAAAALLTYSVFDADPDSVRVLVRRTCDVIGDYVPAGERRDLARSALVATTFGYSDPVRSAFADCAANPPDELMTAVLLFTNGDRSGATRQLDHLKAIDSGKEPGKGLRMSYRTARLRLALGDTTSALAELDEIIRTLPIHDPALLDDITHVVSLVRSFALRAQIADVRGDRRQAASDARVVVALWQDADSQLQPLVRSMRAMTSNR